MLDHFYFLFFLSILLLSNIGYGFVFTNFFKKSFDHLNLGFLGLIGFFIIVIISYFTSYFFAHDFKHNLVLHSVGLVSFIHFLVKKKNINEFKRLLLIYFIFLIGVYVWKNHDDFGYYHLTYALNLSENKIIFGTGLFGHGFRTSSSLFFYHSTTYLPLIKYYLFHSGPFIILIYFNYVILDKLYTNYKLKKFSLSFFFLILSFVYVNVVFYRIAEHGTDRTPQILIFLIFGLFLEQINNNFREKKKFSEFNILIILIFLAASMKVIYILYIFLIPIIFIYNNFDLKVYLKKNFLIPIFCFLIIFFNSFNSFLSTGCFVYPEKKTCLFNQYPWSLPENEVERMSLHYEWWAKAGGGAGYNHEMKQSDYVKQFNWLTNWIDRHFFNKVLDTLLGTILISLIVFFLFRTAKKVKIKTNKIKLVYVFIFILIMEWFFKHPSMRYGGYVLLALPIFIYTSSKLATYKFNSKKIFVKIIAICLLTISIYNIRNIIRLDSELKNYYGGHNILISPFFYLPDIKTEIIFNSEELKIYKPINNMCWNAPTPCSNRSKLKAIDWSGYKLIQRDND